jgi:energy-coupling factor transporter transmembrane protein EcfT
LRDLELSFRKGDSAFHRMDPFSKTLFIVGISFAAIFNSSLYVGIGIFVFAFTCAAFFSGVPLRTYWAFGKIIIPFILILSTVFPFFYGGQLSVGSDEIAIRTPIKDLSWAALGFGALLGLRFLAIGIAGLTYAFTTHPTDMVQNFARKGLDYRLVHAPVLGLVLFPSFIQLGQEISTTQKIRDLGQERNAVSRKLIRLKHLAFSMLVLGLRRGETQAMALDIRGYGAHKHRTFMRPMPSTRAGRIFGWTVFILAAVYLAFQIGNLAGHMQWDMKL